MNKKDLIIVVISGVSVIVLSFCGYLLSELSMEYQNYSGDVPIILQ